MVEAKFKFSTIKGRLNHKIKIKRSDPLISQIINNEDVRPLKKLFRVKRKI